MRLPRTGRDWAYLGVGIGFAASITANVASTVLRETTVPLWLRIPFATLWPVLTYVAIEVLVRTDWEDRWSHKAIRSVLTVPVGAVAAFVSYLHQHHLMVVAGEPGLAQGFGPLAIDGMLFGMTATLIAARVKPLPAETSPAPSPLIEAYLKEREEEISAPVEEMPPVRKERAPRASWDVRKVAEMLLAEERQADIISATGIGRSTLGRYSRVVRMLKEDPRKEISSTEKVPAEHVQVIRELVRR